MDYVKRLSHYLDDLGPNLDIVKEAVATLEAVFEYKSENELLHNSRPEAIAYLALKFLEHEGASFHVNAGKVSVHPSVLK